MSTVIDRPATASSTRAKMLIGGEWVDAADGRTFKVTDPAHRGRVVAEAPVAAAADVDRAVRAAAAAFPKWSATHWRDRAAALSKAADALEARAEEIARLVSTETGNAIRNISRPEVKSVVEVFRYFAGVASETKGETVPLGESVLSYTRREPYGVVGAIVPWNVPLVLSAVKIGPALMAGNTMVLKPSADAPLAVLELARVCQQFLPPGVLNVVTGPGDETGAALAQHPLVRKLSFTGNTETGKSVMRAAAERIVPVSLELGGKSPQIVFADAHQPEVVDGVIAAMRFTRQGQSCTAGSRLYLHAKVFDAFLADLTAKLATLRVGDPLDDSTDMGSLINERQWKKVTGFIDEGAKQEGARLAIGGLPPREGPMAEGYFVGPTVIANVKNDWRVAREEVFGPVLAAIPWTDEDEVVRWANDTHYGLAAFVWTHDIGKALRTAHRIEAGWVQVNQGAGQSPGHSYGGYKQSGIGREYSLEGMLDGFTQRKSVTVNLAL
ncbi:MAG TPA: aldehyde dehydrogenase family protein [Candidatus Limnocylindria bacterium]|nr:aldehyde dehydrogenase family protein [Candidatus Limnocylindria bacterium]